MTWDASSEPPVYLPPESTPNLSDPSSTLHYSVATDTYSLVLTFYELLTGRRPYAHSGLQKLSGEDFLVELFAYKHEETSPIDEQALGSVLDRRATEDVMEILRAGLEPDPIKRASLQTLLGMCRRHFRVRDRRKKDTGNYKFDSVKGLRLKQTRFPRLSEQARERRHTKR